MGVQGFTPFLQKFFPDVLKLFPNRLEALRGKTIVIDGTLITQRFHYIENESPHQHVARWYNLARQLRKYEVNTICVFDGKQRNEAKANEAQRRRKAMELARTRGSLEEERFQRLHSLSESLLQLRDAAAQTRSEIGQALKASTDDTSSQVLLDQKVDELREISAQTTEEVAAPQEEAKQDTPLTPIPEAAAPEKAEMNIAQLAEQLNLLHLNYKATTAKLASIPALQDGVSAIPGETTQTMTKTQYQLTCEEGKLWEYVANAQNSLLSGGSDVTQQELDSMLNRSYAMTTSFRRRNNTPTSTTYSESKEILGAMGILCIDATGAVEGEALASSIVLSGHADYVATEDTDVLAYGAPMIRNLTGYEDPLLVISGTEVRETLELDQSAYLDFVLLLGTDFSQRIKNLGPVKALSLIKEHKSIEGVLDSIANQPRYTLKLPRDAYLAQVNIAREVFRTLPPPPSPESLQKLEADDDLAKEILAKYAVERYAIDDIAESEALAGNLFSDNPAGQSSFNLHRNVRPLERPGLVSKRLNVRWQDSSRQWSEPDVTGRLSAVEEPSTLEVGLAWNLEVPDVPRQ